MFKHKISAEEPGKTVSADPAASDAAQMQAAHAIRQSLAFAKIVSLLMRSPLYRHYAIADLEWLVIPPLATGMLALAEAKPQPDGPAVPVAAVLWASVSPEIDNRLAENPAAPIRLRPDEWTSGDVIWVIAAIGDPKVASALLDQLRTTALKNRNVKARVAGEDGKVIVKSF